MKVFEVTTEYIKNGSDEVITERQYVNSATNDLKSVVDYFTEHCNHYEKDLLGVREVVTVVQHICSEWEKDE